MSVPERGRLAGPGPVLVIDDSPLLLQLQRRQLEALGLTVQEATSAQQARECLAAARFALILVELLLARDNGFRLGLELRRASGAPVALMSASGRASDREWATRLGFSAVLARPCSRAALQRLCRAAGLELEPLP